MSGTGGVSVSPVVGVVVPVGVVVLVGVVVADVLLASARVAFALLFESTRAVFALAFASTRAAFAFAFASTRAVRVDGDDGALAFPVVLTVLALGPFEVCETLVVRGELFGADAFGPDVFGPDVVVFGDDTLGVFAFTDTWCVFGADPFLPCAGNDTDEAATNAMVETNAINVRVMNSSRGAKAPITHCRAIGVPFLAVVKCCDCFS